MKALNHSRIKTHFSKHLNCTISTLALVSSTPKGGFTLSGDLKSYATDLYPILKAFFNAKNPLPSSPMAFHGVCFDKKLTSLYVAVKPKPSDAEAHRCLGALFYKKILSDKRAEVTLDMDQFSEGALLAFCEGLFLADYFFETHKKNKLHDINITFCSSKKLAGLQKKVSAVSELCDAVKFARYLGDQPGNHMSPQILARETQAALKPYKNIKVDIWNLKKIEAAKMGGLISVSQGSNEEPRLIIMEYKGAAASRKPLCLVGKGLTFDAGGISIKPGKGMQDMKYDKCGGTNVIAAMLAIAKLKVRANVIGVVPSSENLLGDNATRPGDIITAHNGVTVEVNNTDAEGRLILMDALSYACKKYKPKAIVDVATLTGAMVVALGNVYTGFFTKNDQLKKIFLKASQKTGEKAWHMPLDEQFSKEMKGTYADLSNLGKSPFGGSATAAAFLENFVDKNIPWMHLDIAGTAWHTGEHLSYCPTKGASGVMVRTFVELARSLG